MNQAASIVSQRKGAERGQEDKSEGKSVTSGKWKATGGPRERGTGVERVGVLHSAGGARSRRHSREGGRGVRRVFVEAELKGEWKHPASKALEARSRGLQRREEDRVPASGACCWGQVTSCNVGTNVITCS